MKRLMIVMISIIFVALIINCDNDLVGPKNEEPEVTASIKLVPVGNNNLSKIITDENGKQWLPATEVSHYTSLAKTAAATIEFGQMKNTTNLMYVVVNTGKLDVFDIIFESQDLTVIPSTIGLITVGGISDGEVNALPIITITKEHVKPMSGVGSLLNMEVGEFTDTLSVSYKYTSKSTTYTLLDKYDVAGTKMGAVIDLVVSNTKIENYVNNVFYQQLTNYDFNFSVYDANLDSTDLDSVIITNSGNASIPLKIKSACHSHTVLDTNIVGQSQIDLTGILGNASQNESVGEVLILGENINQLYIFSFAGKIYTNGIAGAIIGMK